MARNTILRPYGTVPGVTAGPPDTATETRELRVRLSELGRDVEEVRRRLGLATGAASPYVAGLPPFEIHVLVDRYGADVTATLTVDAKFVYVSAAVERLFGWWPQELLGRSLFEFCRRDELSPGWRGARLSRLDPETTETLRFRCAGHDERWVEMRGALAAGDDGEELIVVVMRDVSAQHVLETAAASLRDRLEQFKGVDAPTGLPNRRRFHEHIERLVREAERGRRFVLALIDVDRPSSIETVDRRERDDALLAVARALQASARDVDMLARYGDTEFAIVYVDVDLAQAVVLAERQRQAVAANSGETTASTVSIGLAECPVGAVAITKVLDSADYALARAREAGGNRIGR